MVLSIDYSYAYDYSYFYQAYEEHLDICIYQMFQFTSTADLIKFDVTLTLQDETILIRADSSLFFCLRRL